MTSRPGEPDFSILPNVPIWLSQYKEKFDEISAPYTLPKVNYEGSFSHRDLYQNTSQIYVAIPIKNQETGIFLILESLCKSMDREFSIGLVLDNCTDKTAEEVYKFINKKFSSFPHLIRIDILSSEADLFESTCENLLFLLCKEPYYMSLQADIFLADRTFIARAILAFEQNPKLFGVSGRARVSFQRNLVMAQTKILRVMANVPNYFLPQVFNRKFLGWYQPRNGYFGDVSDYPKSKMWFSRRQLLTLYPGEAVIRGPLIWRSEVFRNLGGFNDISYYLGRDDCDLSLRARLELGMYVAYLPSRSYSFPHAGTTRKTRDRAAVEELRARKELSRVNPGILDGYWGGNVQIEPVQFAEIRIRKN